MKTIRYGSLLSALVLPLGVFGQALYSVPVVREPNTTSFTETVSTLSSELELLTPQEYQSHPEYGMLPYDAPCTDCMELVDRRTSSTRYYVRNGSEGRSFLTQASITNLHYKDALGSWRTMDPRIRPIIRADHVYVADRQPAVLTLDMLQGIHSMRMMDGADMQIQFGRRWFQTHDLTDAEHVQEAVLTNYTAGDDGARVNHIFSHTDQELISGKSSIKSNYILSDAGFIDAALPYVVIEDVFTMPEGYTLKRDIYEGMYNSHGYWFGDLIIENSDGMEMARIAKPVVYDSSEDPYYGEFTNDDISAYAFVQSGNVCTVYTMVSTAWLRSEHRVLPIVIDPTVFGTTTTWTGTQGADDAPNWCTVTLAVPTPANATLTGSSIHWEAVATGLVCPPACRLNDLQVQIFTTCDYSPAPGGVWICAGCNVAGTWIPTVDDGTTQDLVECFTPQCTPFNINFTINFNQFNCVTPGTCNTSCAYLQEFQVIIEGETLAATALAGGAATYTVLDCTDQSGWLSASTPNYGVPPYTYTWTPGGYTFSPVYVTFPMGVTVYTLTMTDACGNTVVDNVTVTNNCLTLPIPLTEFSGYHKDQKNILNWTLSPEHANRMFFIERSTNGADFTQIDIVDGQFISGDQFTYSDDAVTLPVHYYRLRQLEENGDTIYSQIIAIQTEAASDILSIQKFDPASGQLQLILVSQFNGPANLNLYDLTGRIMTSMPVHVQDGLNFVQCQLPVLSRGSYVVAITGTEVHASAQMVY